MSDDYSVSETEKKEFAAAYLLDKMINGPMTFPTWLEGNDKDLEPVLEFMMMRDYISIQHNRYVPNHKGRKILQEFGRRYTDFLENFDIFSAVDLEEGEFAFAAWFEIEDDEEWDNYLEQERWEDLRIAATEYKGLNPVEIVFMSFLNEKRFGNTGEGWQFDLLLGSIWDEILEICNTAISVDDLGYEDEEGAVSGEDVIRDILKQGAELNIELHEEERAEEEENAFELASDGYDYGRYKDTHEYVKPVRRDVISRDTYHKYRDPDYHSPVWKRRRWYDDWDD